jgi:hypothetical protein
MSKREAISAREPEVKQQNPVCELKEWQQNQWCEY